MEIDVNHTKKNIKIKKFYIMTIPCSGKTTFVNEHNGYYKKIKLYDIDEIDIIAKEKNKLSKFKNRIREKLRIGNIIIRKPFDKFFEPIVKPGISKKVENYEIHTDKSYCILGRNIPFLIDGFIFASVIPEEDQLKEQLGKRRINNPNMRYKNWKMIKNKYYNLKYTTKKYNLPNFSSFEKALEYFNEMV